MFASLLLLAPAASAHDVLESTSPADGATVATVPGQITLTFDNTPAAIGSQIEVKDPSGTDWATGSVQVTDHVASQQLKPGAPAGRYTVNWRMVSADSHPIDGTFSFNATAGSAGGSGQAAGTPVPVQVPASAATASGGFPWLGVGIAVLVVLVVAGIAVVVRRRLRGEED
jgi:hypothetical protein